jgi:riboflavin kinase/FMN adenylyltransferase
MLNIGVRPTFRTGGPRTIEVHLFDVSGDLTGRTLTVDFLKRLRGERTFASAGDLVRQLNEDRDACLRQIAAHHLQSS